MTDVPNFRERAANYDALRPQGRGWWMAFDAMVRDGDLRGRRVVDVGCGTGALAEALVRHASAKVWGFDASAEMVAVARGRGAPGAGFKVGSAESLPVRDGWFERATMSLVVHLIDRVPAFREVRRVLVDDGRLVIATFAPEHFATAWLGRLFPSLEAIDLARFPTEARLRDELAAGGLPAVRVSRADSREGLSREDALARIRGRHISTFDLLPADEVTAGVARAERDLPEVVDLVQRYLIVTASAR